MVEVVPYSDVRSETERLWALGWPVSLGMAGFVLMRATDTIMVGALGKEELAAMGMGNMWAFGLAILGHGAARGLDPAVAQAFGARDKLAAGRTLVRGWLFALVISVPIMLLHALTAEGLGLLGQPEHLLADAESYALASMWGLPFAFCFDATRQFQQGLGVMRPATWVVLVAVAVNAVLNSVLIYGGFGIPAMGIVGSGIATAIAQTFVLVALVWVTRDLLREWWPGWEGVFEVAPLLALAGNAIPASLQFAMEVWAFIAAGLMMGWMGDLELDAHIIALNLSSLTFMLPLGLSAAAATRVGNLIGAERPWQTSGWVAIGFGATIMLVSAAAFLTIPDVLVDPYSNEPDVLLLGASLLPIAALFQVFDGTQAVSFGVLRGAGDIKVPSLANLVAYYGIALPGGYYLAFPMGMGPAGVWYGLTMGLATVAMMLLVRVVWIGHRGGVRVEA